MLKLTYIAVISAFLAPLIPTNANAQLDLFTPVDVGLQGYCLEHPELRNDPRCARYYRKRGNHRQNTRERSRSTKNSCSRLVSRLEQLDRQGVERATVKLPGGGTITDSPDDLIDDVRARCNRRSNRHLKRFDR
jgi:hypothetical protein